MAARRFASTVAIVALVLTAVAGVAWGAQEKGRALVDEGLAKYRSGDLAGALAAFTQATEARPALPQAFYGRAAVQFIMGKFTEASDTLQKWVDMNQTDSFAWMWAYVANARGGSADKGTLSSMQALTDEASWLGLTLQLFMDQITPDDYMTNVKEEEAAAGTRANELIIVRAHFMEGEAALLKGDKKAAAAHFKAAIGAQGPFQWEREMARAELKRLEPGVPVDSTGAK